MIRTWECRCYLYFYSYCNGRRYLIYFRFLYVTWERAVPNFIMITPSLGKKKQQRMKQRMNKWTVSAETTGTTSHLVTYCGLLLPMIRSSLIRETCTVHHRRSTKRLGFAPHTRARPTADHEHAETSAQGQPGCVAGTENGHPTHWHCHCHRWNWAINWFRLGRVSSS